MKIRLDNKFNAFPNKTILGYVGETNARTITFSGLSVSGANSYSMVIDYGDGENYEVNIVDGVYTVDASVLKRPGLVNCQVLAKALSEDGTTYTIVKKSNIFALNIGKSIDPGAIPTYEQATSAVEKLIQINPNANDVLKFTEQIDQNVDDIAELSGSVEELKGDLGEIDDLFLKKELLVNLSSFIDESTGNYKNAGRYFYTPADNRVGITPDSNYACIPVELKAGTYSVQNINPYYSFYVLNGQAVRFGGAENAFISKTFELPIDTTVYVTVRVVSSSNGHKTVAIASGDTIPEDISTLGIFNFDTAMKLDSVAKLEEKIPTVITVKKDGTGDFSTLKEAVYYSQSHSDLTIEVYEGTYDLIEEFGSDYYENLGNTSSNEGLHLGNNVHIIFSSNSKVICNYEGDNANVHKYFSPFTCSVNGNHKGFTLENLDLECSNVRYAIHDEVLGQKGRYINRYKNCRVYIDNTSNSNWSNRQCIGGGLGGNGYIEIDGCYFESVATTSKPNGVGIVSYHCGNGTSGDNYSSKVIIKNSYFANNDTVRCSYYGNQTTMSILNVNNCSLGSLSYIGQENTNYTTVNMQLIAFNNTVRQG